MDSETDKKLEQLLDRELKRLPELQAPQTLVPRLIARIQRLEVRPWWAQPWYRWPAGFRVLSLLLLGALLAVAFDRDAALWIESAETTMAAIGAWLNRVAVVGEIAGVLGNAAWLLLQTVGLIWGFLAVTLLLLAYFFFVGVGTLCFRLAFNRR